MRTLVTGGGGFLGRHIVQRLLERGDAVRVLARNRYPGLEEAGAESSVADLRNASAVQEAMAGVDVVFHVAAKAGYWGPIDEYRSVNVEGTRNVLRAMRHAGASCLIYTSTPSVVGYARDVENGGGDLPYARRHESPYPETKAEAEQLVRAADAPGLATVALRPHLIIGPGDNHLLPRIVTRAAQGRLPRVGDGTNRVDLTYVDNAAQAHLDAADALERNPSGCGGRAYFISNAEPVVLWDWLNRLLRALGLREVRAKLSLPVARALGATLELAWRTLRLDGEPRLTRFLASALARSHWYDMGPARADLGYEASVSMQEGTRRTVRWLRETLAIGSKSPSRVDALPRRQVRRRREEVPPRFP